jgi:hypothetical protein
MRLYEIASVIHRLEQTKRFIQSYNRYEQGFPRLRDQFIAFCQAKIQGRKFGQKDYPFTNEPLKGLGHAHLIHGKVILIYYIKNRILYLYDLVEHTAIDTPAQSKALRKFIDGLSQKDFSELNINSEQKTLSKEQKNHLNALFYEIAASMPELIKDALHGSWDDLNDFAMETVQEPIELIYAAYGGQQQLKNDLATVLRQFSIAH